MAKVEKKKKIKLSKHAKAVWQYVAQEIDSIDKSIKPIRDAIKYLKENGQL